MKSAKTPQLKERKKMCHHTWRHLCKNTTCSIGSGCKNVQCIYCKVMLQADTDRVNKEYYATHKEEKIKALEELAKSPEFKQYSKAWWKVEEHRLQFGHLPFKDCCKNL
jgi:aerobic-type carbon monoxide dehydrogenase small subunit (CoxS/CutS family)